MNDQTVYFYSSLKTSKSRVPETNPRIEPATCTEAESFVLRVLDNSMEPEFRRGCMIVIDPTGRATDGSFVLARHSSDTDSSRNSEKADDQAIDGFVFRQLKQDSRGGWLLTPLNKVYREEILPVTLEAIVGVIVQRAGTRRSYHKSYD